jgi:AcrR family transcriptional regulator
MQTDRQKEIIRVSLDLISEKGIQGLTIKNLAGRIGISEPAIYRHYENKIEILLAILDLFRENTVRVFEGEKNFAGTALDKIEYIFSRQFRILAETPQLVAVIFSEEIFRNEPVLMERIGAIMDQINRSVTEIITLGQTKREVRQDVEAGHLAIMIMGGLRLFVKRWQMKAYSFDLMSEGASFLKTVKIIIS